jgi:hypothetical protein
VHAFLMFGLLLATAGPLPEGKSSVELQFGDVPLKVFTYKPKSYSNGPIIMVFHGVLRNAEEYRDDSIEMGDRFRALIVAPLFDDTLFPKRKYQFGGIVNEGKATPRDQWTGEYVNRITKVIREREGRANMPLYLIGHSGGGQFLVRMAAFVKTDATQIVAANAGTQLFPSLTYDFPFGLGGLPNELQTDEQLKDYLAQPLTFYLGSNDIERDEYLDVTPAADAQGNTRFERGKNVFAAGKKLAEERKWRFGWTLVIAPDVEHDHTKMFNNPQCAAALGLTKSD